jgi:hypothetical protein
MYKNNPYLYMREELQRTADKPVDVELSEKRLRDLQLSFQPGEVARGAVLGGIAAPAFQVAGDLIEDGSAGLNKWKANKGIGGVRRGASKALIGVAAGAAMPFVRNRMERYLESHRLEQLKKHYGELEGAPPPAAMAHPLELGQQLNNE